MKVFLGYQNILDLKRWPNTLWNEESKEIKDFMKLEDEGVHCKRYDGHCTK
jgi:hypothetical protein